MARFKDIFLIQDIFHHVFADPAFVCGGHVLNSALGRLRTK